MGDEELGVLLQVGRVARRAKEHVVGIVKEGVTLLEVCEAVESFIISEGCRPAFPCNVCVDHVAAHYSPPPNDGSTIAPSSIVKVDIGAELDGYIADTAVSISLSPELDRLVIAAESALRAAIRVMKQGIRLGEVGSTIQSTIQSHGLKPIRNLTGHEISRYNLHAGTSIPNVSVPDFRKIQGGKVYAIEPFVTLPEGSGEVMGAGIFTIFRHQPGRFKTKDLRKEELVLLDHIDRSFKGLPYSPRWLIKDGTIGDLSTHDRLFRSGRIHGYPVLVEKRGKPVAQAEATVYVGEDGCEVLT